MAKRTFEKRSQNIACAGAARSALRDTPCKFAISTACLPARWVGA
jgi:hypothetical protein